MDLEALASQRAAEVVLGSGCRAIASSSPDPEGGNLADEERTARMSSPARKRPEGKLREDVAAYNTKAGTPIRGPFDAALRTLMLPRLQAVALFRLAQRVHPRSAQLATLIKTFNQALTGADIATEASIDGGLQLFHPQGVVIGPDCRIGSRCIVMSCVVVGTGPGGSPTLGDDVILGAHSMVLGGLVLEDRVSVGAGALVTTSVPEGGKVRAVAAVVTPVTN
jgi:serine O-acetyltransferase